VAKQLVRSSCRQGLTSVSCATLCYVEGSKPNGFENFRPELDVGIADPLVNTCTLSALQFLVVLPSGECICNVQILPNFFVILVNLMSDYCTLFSLFS